MNFKMIFHIISWILFVEAGLMVPGMLISVVLQESAAVHGFLVTEGVILCTAGLMFVLTRNAKRGSFYQREGFLTTGLTWIIMSALGCLPFYISGEIPAYIDCFFEMVSGFTTTGSSILDDVEALSKGLIFWRSFSHWIGGMGILVFLMAIVPLGGRNQGFTLHILRAESPGPSVGKMVPKMKNTAFILYAIYFGMTILNIVFLLVGGMPVFDAFCIAFGTAGTGGFGIKADSMGSYSPYLQNVTTVFMLLFSVNFSIYYLILLKKFKAAFFDEEFRLFWIVVFSAIALIAWNVRPMYDTLEETIRHSAFTVGTIISTTGYGTTDFDLWPAFSKAIILFLMFCGACAGSTGGGLKQIRMLLLMKGLRRNIHTNLHPNEVKKIRVNGRVMDEVVMNNTYAYLVAYAAILILSFIVVSLDGFDVETNFSAVMATFNNIGPGLGKVGPTCSFSAYSPLSKLVMSLDMLAGRLEIYPILMLGSRSCWKSAR